ncbi:ATP-binding protein [Hyphomonas oceanitis]|uniref:ATP-binding protein n=1 Tax=Hyphomonas oceanitis TaxID=81033 RepID=UPI003002A380
MANLLKTNVAQHGLTALIQRLGRDCSPTQFVREFTMNSIEAVQRTKEDGRVLVDADWSLFDQLGTHKVSFVDTGDGMTGEEMLAHLNNLSSSGGVNNDFENYGMGAKIAALTRNHLGIIYESWKDGVGSRIVIHFDEEERSYGIKPSLNDHGGSDWVILLDESVKPDIIQDHGTRVTLLGMTLEEDTMQPPPEARGGRENWVFQYLNTRFFDVPESVDLQARIGYYREKENTKHNYTRRVKGQRASLDANCDASGTVKISDAIVHWWIMSKERSGHGREFLMGHTGCINQNELFDIAFGRANMAPGFGVIFGKEDIVLYVEPISGYVQDTTRTRLVQEDGSSLPWSRWQDEFRQAMPEAIKKFMEARMGAAENESHSETIRERLKAIAKFFSISRYQANSSGSIFADPDSETRSKTGSGAVNTSGSGGLRKTGGTAAAGALDTILLAGKKEGGLRSEEVQPDKFPDVKWVSASDGTRADDELEDRAAEYLHRDNLIKANADFQGFTDIIKHFAEVYESIPNSEAIIRNEVQEAFEQQLVEVVTGALSFRNRPKWNPDHFKAAVSEESLTTAVMSRYHIITAIKRSIGSKLGKAAKAMESAD